MLARDYNGGNFQFNKNIDFNILTNAKQKIKITYDSKPKHITALRAFM